MVRRAKLNAILLDFNVMMEFQVFVEIKLIY